MGPKRRKLLENSWAGLFREEILPVLPVKKVAPYYSKKEGRPTKEFYSILGVMVLQESFNLSDQEAMSQFSFNIQWQYALNITQDDDASTYLCEKTL